MSGYLLLLLGFALGFLTAAIVSRDRASGERAGDRLPHEAPHPQSWAQADPDYIEYRRERALRARFDQESS